MKEVGQERQRVLLNMEPASDPTQVKVLGGNWVSCDVLDWVKLV
jgi:hypothetical protein